MENIAFHEGNDILSVIRCCKRVLEISPGQLSRTYRRTLPLRHFLPDIPFGNFKSKKFPRTVTGQFVADNSLQNIILISFIGYL